MRIKFTPAAIARLPQPPKGKQVVYWDQSLPGFGILVSSTTRSWVVQRGSMPRRTIERVDLLPLAEARDTALEWLRLMGRGIDPKAHTQAEAAAAAAAGVTLQAALDAYVANRRAGTLRPKTKLLYEKLVGKHLSDWLKQPCGAITPAMVAERFTLIIKAAKARGERGASANCTLRILRAILNDARRTNPALPPDPVAIALTGRWQPETRRTRRIPDDKFEVFFDTVDAMPNLLHRTLITVLVYTGMRFREAAGLTWAEVDLQQRLIHLPEERTKARRAVGIPLSQEPFRMLRGLRTLGRVTSNHVFASPLSKSGHLEDLGDQFDAISKAIGQRLSAHDLRRSYAVAAHDAGVDMLDLKRLLNHSTAQDVTLGYIPPKLDRLVRAQTIIGKHLDALRLGKAGKGRKAA